MRRDRTRLSLLAGWLFADLFLVLLLAGLAELPARPDTPDPGSSPSKDPSTFEQGLELRPLEFVLNVSPDSFRSGDTDTLIDRVKSTLRNRGYGNREVGFVLVFAEGTDPGIAQQTANRAYKALRGEDHFTMSAGYGYWGGSGSKFEFKVFFLKLASIFGRAV